MKPMTRPMMGFKSFKAASATLAGIEFYHMVIKGQYAFNNIALPVWEQGYALAA